MADSNTASCDRCEAQFLIGAEQCSKCSELAESGAKETTLPTRTRPGRKLSLPPNDSSSAHESSEDQSEPVRRRTRPRISYAQEALNSAFACQSETISPFLQPMFRMSERSRTDSHRKPRRNLSSSSSCSYSSFYSIPASPDMTSTVSTPFYAGTQSLPPSRRATPEVPLTEYAPMAAGFARLAQGRALVNAGPMDGSRSLDETPSISLHARMFAGSG